MHIWRPWKLFIPPPVHLRPKIFYSLDLKRTILNEALPHLLQQIMEQFINSCVQEVWMRRILVIRNVNLTSWVNLSSTDQVEVIPS